MTRWALAVSLVLGALLSACRTTGAPDGDVIPVLKGTAFYDDLPSEELAWWGSMSRDTYSGAAYGFGVNKIPLDLPVEEVGNLDLYGGDQEARLEPFVSYEGFVIIYGKVELRAVPDSVLGYGTLYVGEIGEIEGGRIGCDPRRIPEAERAGAVVVSGDCNYYLELPEQERRYLGTLRVGERGPPPPPDRSQYPYFLDTEGGRLFVGAEVRPELERLVGREVTVDGKLLEVRDGRGPHQVLLIGVVREE